MKATLTLSTYDWDNISHIINKHLDLFSGMNTQEENRTRLLQKRFRDAYKIAKREAQPPQPQENDNE